MGQAGHKARRHRSAVKSCRKRTNERSSGVQDCVNQSLTPNKNGKILMQKETQDDQQRFAVEGPSSFVEMSNCEYGLHESDDESTMTAEPGSSLSVDGLKPAWFDSARTEVTLGADSEQDVSTRSPDKRQFQDIWSTNVDFSSIRCSFTMSSASENQSVGESTLSEENKKQTAEDRPENDQKVVNVESCWVMEFGQKEQVGVSDWDASRIPVSDDFVSDTAEEKNCYFQFVGVDDDFGALPAMYFKDDYDEEKVSAGNSAKISFTNEENREATPISTEIMEVCEKGKTGEMAQKTLIKKCFEKIDDRMTVDKRDDGIESLDRSSLDMEESLEVDTEGESPANSMVKRVCSTVKKMGFIGTFMQQWSRDVENIDEEVDQVRKIKERKELKWLKER